MHHLPHECRTSDAPDHVGAAAAAYRASMRALADEVTALVEAGVDPRTIAKKVGLTIASIGATLAKAGYGNVARTWNTWRKEATP